MCNSLPRSIRLSLPHEESIRWKGRLQSRLEGFTLPELIATIAILLLMSSVALPLVRVQIVRAHETELRRDLRELRTAIDRYKYLADYGMVPTKADTYGYPPDLESLVEGVPFHGVVGVKYKFLRRIPIDPMTGSTDWGLRSMQDDPDSRSWGGQNVFDVYSKSNKTALDGTAYADW